MNDTDGEQRERVRIVAVALQLSLVLDDGAGGPLTPLNPQQVVIPGHEWPSYPARLDEELKVLEGRANSDPEYRAALVGRLNAG